MQRSDNFRVTTGARKKSLKVIVGIILGVLIVAAIVVPSVLLTKENSTTSQEGMFI